MWAYNNYSELYHHGILGQKWGVRRYQNLDGSLTEAGRRRYKRENKKERRALIKKLSKRLPEYRKDSRRFTDEWYSKPEAKDLLPAEKFVYGREYTNAQLKKIW